MDLSRSAGTKTLFRAQKHPTGSTSGNVTRHGFRAPSTGRSWDPSLSLSCTRFFRLQQSWRESWQHVAFPDPREVLTRPRDVQNHQPCCPGNSNLLSASVYITHSGEPHAQALRTIILQRVTYSGKESGPILTNTEQKKHLIQNCY